MKKENSKINLQEYDISPDIIDLIPEHLVRKHQIIPIGMRKDKLMIAISDPFNFFVIDDIRSHISMDLLPIMASNKDIANLIDKYYGKDSKEGISIQSLKNIEELKFNISETSVVELLEFMIYEAIKYRASDIHIEPNVEGIRIRFRIDGDLKEIMNLDISILAPLVTRIKIMGGMNIAESRIPQDGRVEFRINGREVDMRISSLPIIYGEKIVIRLLDKYSNNLDRYNLGFNKSDLNILDKILDHPNGMVLITGPAGSGKTTTLYTILKELNMEEKNIITIEDPIEYKLNGINQVQVNNKAGITFASGLRAILRQDPDIIMVGEIRDEETAKIATRAAITGHLIFSTLHTNDGASAIIRLMDMGVEPYFLSTALIGVISQRLVKLLCDSCKQSYNTDFIEREILGIQKDRKINLYRANGCENCNNGYIGRTAIYELIHIDKNLRRMISSKAEVDKIRLYSKEKGMSTLISSGIDLALSGRTSLDEIIKIGIMAELE